MAATIESTDEKIREKIKNLYIAASEIKKIFTDDPKLFTDITQRNNIWLNIIINEIEALNERYNLISSNILVKYYSAKKVISEEKLTSEYYKIINCNNIIASIDERLISISHIANHIDGAIVDIITDNHINLVDSDSASADETIVRDLSNNALFSRLNFINELLEHTYKIDISIERKVSNYNICKCGLKMAIIPQLSELMCDCGRIKILQGVAFEDSQFNQDGQKSKNSIYRPCRHFRFWMDRILGDEKKSFTVAEEAAIKDTIDKYGYKPRDITCRIMRKILKDANLTYLNYHVPKLVKKFSGKTFPRLTSKEYKAAELKFTKMMEIYDRVIKQNKGGNRPYYPYFILKIIEMMFRDDTEKIRIIENIHLQTGETVKKNDLVLQVIISNSDPNDEFEYKPTPPYLLIEYD